MYHLSHPIYLSVCLCTYLPPYSSLFCLLFHLSICFPGGPVLKKPTCRGRRHKGPRFNPWIRKIPWRRRWPPTLVFLPGKLRGQRTLVGDNPWGHRELDMADHSTDTSINVSTCLPTYLKSVNLHIHPLSPTYLFIYNFSTYLHFIFVSTSILIYFLICHPSISFPACHICLSMHLSTYHLSVWVLSRFSHV